MSPEEEILREFACGCEICAHSSVLCPATTSALILALVAARAAIAEEREALEGMILDLFVQGCFVGPVESGKYDHCCISAYEEAQEYLIRRGLIKKKDCLG